MAEDVFNENDDDDLVVVETEDEKIPVAEDDAPAAEEPEEQSDEDEEDEERMGVSDEDTEQEVTKRQTRDRRTRRQIQKQAKERSQRELEFLRQQNAELMQLLLPTIKADFILLDRWYAALAPTPRAELSLPICGMSGRRDIHCSRADIDGWQEHTHGTLETLEYNGGHFFLQSQEARVVGDIRARLDMLRRGA